MIERRFITWLSGASIYINYNRYGYEYGHGFLIASSYNEDSKLEEAVNNLGAGDLDASMAIEYINNNALVVACNINPIIAMAELVGHLHQIYKKEALW